MLQVADLTGKGATFIPEFWNFCYVFPRKFAKYCWKFVYTCLIHCSQFNIIFYDKNLSYLEGCSVHVMCFDTPQIGGQSVFPVGSWWILVKRLFVWVSVLVDSSVLVRIISSFEISKNESTTSFDFRHEVQILKALRSRV